MVRLLAIWYSHNVPSVTLLIASLESIREARDGAACEVEVVTCPWRSIPGNPFTEVIAEGMIGPPHTNIIRQMRQCLSAARSGYGAVCFMEHDVLYPPDYFDRVHGVLHRQPDIDVVDHRDCIGLNSTGYLKPTSKDYFAPMHQLTVRSPLIVPNLARAEADAKKHGACILEPPGEMVLDGHARKVKRQVYSYGRRTIPSVHVNYYGRLTNHGESWFEKVSTMDGGKPLTVHPHWGSMDKYPLADPARKLDVKDTSIPAIKKKLLGKKKYRNTLYVATLAPPGTYTTPGRHLIVTNGESQAGSIPSLSNWADHIVLSDEKYLPLVPDEHRSKVRVARRRV